MTQFDSFNLANHCIQKKRFQDTGHRKVLNYIFNLFIHPTFLVQKWYPTRVGHCQADVSINAAHLDGDTELSPWHR